MLHTSPPSSPDEPFNNFRAWIDEFYDVEERLKIQNCERARRASCVHCSTVLLFKVYHKFSSSSSSLRLSSFLYTSCWLKQHRLLDAPSPLLGALFRRQMIFVHGWDPFSRGSVSKVVAHINLTTIQTKKYARFCMVSIDQFMAKWNRWAKHNVRTMFEAELDRMTFYRYDLFRYCISAQKVKK